MKIFKTVMVVVIVITILACLSGCGKSESEYKAAISEHMRSIHSTSIYSYENFEIDEAGVATARLLVNAELEFGGTIELGNSIKLNGECNITSCDWC